MHTLGDFEQKIQSLIRLELTGENCFRNLFLLFAETATDAYSLVA